MPLRADIAMQEPLRVLQVSTSDRFGGSAKMAWCLHQALRARGHESWIAAGHKFTDHADVLVIPNDECRTRWARTWLNAGNILLDLVGKVRGAGRPQKLVLWLGEPKRWLGIRLGHEDVDFPGTWRILELPPQRPDIVHCCNLHGGYFDLRVLPWLSRQVPVIMKPGDMWLLSGHCAHSLGCERWKNGCGHCPATSIYPAICRDATAYNWRRKRDIYARSRLYFVTASRWLMHKVEQSIIAPAIAQQRVIPNGVDLSVFCQGDKKVARTALGLPEDATVCLFLGYQFARRLWTDYATMEDAVARVGAKDRGRQLLLLCVGEEQPERKVGGVQMRFVGYQEDPTRVAQLYRAADVYLHVAHVDTFPNAVLEALACGIPVVATAVGGIPEQVEDGVTGFLIEQGDPIHMADSIARLLSNDNLRKQMGRQAAEDAQRRFDLNRQVEDYLSWYHEILEDWQSKKG